MWNASRPRWQPHDLLMHQSIGMRMTHGGIYQWELERGDQKLQMDLPTRFVLNEMPAIKQAILHGLGIGFIAEWLRGCCEISVALLRLLVVLRVLSASPRLATLISQQPLILDELKTWNLVPLLPSWCPTFGGLRLYYSGHRFVPARLRALISLVHELRLGKA